MSCYHWELQAVLKGLMLKQVDEREKLAELAVNVRYTVHAKKLNARKLFNKKNEERRIHNLFKRVDAQKENKTGLAEKVRQMNDYFKNKFKSE